MHREILYAFIAGFIAGFGSLAGIITLGIRRAAKLEAAEPSECPDEVEAPQAVPQVAIGTGEHRGRRSSQTVCNVCGGNLTALIDGVCVSCRDKARADKPSAEQIAAARSIVKNNGDCMGEPLRGKCAQCPFFEAECLDWSLATTATFARAWLASHGIPVEEAAS